MTTRPPEELDMQTADMERWLPFQFLTSLLRFTSGWFANHALQRTAVALAVDREHSRRPTVLGPAWLSLGR